MVSKSLFICLFILYIIIVSKRNSILILYALMVYLFRSEIEWMKNFREKIGRKTF